MDDFLEKGGGVVKTVLCTRDLSASAPSLCGSITVYNVIRWIGVMRTGDDGGAVVTSVVIDRY